MRTLARACIDEYRAILSDRGVLFIFLAGLIIYTAYYPLPYSPEVVKELPVVPVDQDASTLSRKLLQWVDATEEVRLAASTRNVAEARRRVVNGEAAGFFVIPEGFERSVLRGEQATVALYADACYFLIYRQVHTGCYKAAATLSAGIEIKRFTAAGFGERHARAARDPLPLDSRPLFNPASGYATYVVPGVLMLILQQTLLIGIGMLGGTRNEAFRNAPVPPQGGKDSYVPLLLGRGFAYFSIYILYPLFYLFFIFPLYDLPRAGHTTAVMVFLVPYVLSIVYLGFALSTLFQYREHSIPALIYTSVPAVFLAGFAWPMEAVPTWLRHAALLLPSTSGVAGFLRLNQMGATLHEVRFEWFVLWALCGFYFLLSWVCVQRTQPFPERPHPDLP
ncbi:MAG TPA: ABC transporter permease [Candidatus Hydrogenedentes bacterium]|nr:ABC transporter permease [Candidatus Hydrogenedentota bacterium]